MDIVEETPTDVPGAGDDAADRTGDGADAPTTGMVATPLRPEKNHLLPRPKATPGLAIATERWT